MNADLQIPPILNKSKLPSLDGFRAISIIFVLIAHFFFDYTNFKEATDFGPLGVEIFFVISGFLITSLLIKEKIKDNRINLKAFYIRRALRILPVVVLFLSVLFVLNLIFKLGITNISFLSALFFLKNLPIPNGNDWYTGHFWSLAVEEQYYLIFPFLLSRLTLKQFKYLVLVLILILPVLTYLFFNKIGIIQSNRVVHNITLALVDSISIHTAMILIGSLLSVLLYTSNTFMKIMQSLNKPFVSTLIFIIALILRIPYFQLFSLYFSNTLFAFLIGIVIILNLFEGSLMAKVLNISWLMRIGILSYSLYIWQQLFTRSQPWQGLFPYSNSELLNFTALMLVAYASYTFYEKKFLDYKKRFKVVN